MRNGSDDADLRNGVLCWSFLDIAFNIGGEITKKANFGALVGVFKPNVQNIESFILSKLLHRF